MAECCGECVEKDMEIKELKTKLKEKDKALTSKELRELLGYYYNDLPSDDEEMIKEAFEELR